VGVRACRALAAGGQRPLLESASMAEVGHVNSRDGTRLAIRRSGAGEPLVLVHGSGTSSADWAFTAQHLQDRFEVVTFDRRGRGRSGDGPSYEMARESQDVLAVLEATGAELLVAHSYGALCAMLAAKEAPRLRRLVLYEPPIAVKPDGGLDDLERRVAAGRLDSALEGFLRVAGVPDDQLSAIRSSPAWHVLLDAVPVLPRELRAAAVWRRPVDPIPIPTLFLLGGETSASVYLDGLDELQQTFPNSERRLISGQRHVAHVFAPEEFARLAGGFCAEA
jgi:pimeloyl-ACP methyl ester carboxylesterase